MKDITDFLRQYLAEREWLDIRPSDIAKSVSIEAAELLEIFQWESLTSQDMLARPEQMEHLKKELADVMIYCLEMAIVLNIDPEKAIRDKLAQAAKKYPPEIVKKWHGEPQGTNQEYLAIKKAYREGTDK